MAILLALLVLAVLAFSILSAMIVSIWLGSSLVARHHAPMAALLFFVFIPAMISVCVAASVILILGPLGGIILLGFAVLWIAALAAIWWFQRSQFLSDGRVSAPRITFGPFL